MRRSSTRRRGRGSHMILICIHNYHNYHEIYIFIELAFHTPPFRGPAYQKPYVPVPVAAPAPHLTSKKAPLCVSPRERMPGYGATAVDKKLGLVCPHCKLLLRSAVQTDEGVRLCESCFKEIARWGVRSCWSLNMLLQNLVVVDGPDKCSPVCICRLHWLNYYVGASLSKLACSVEAWVQPMIEVKVDVCSHTASHSADFQSHST